MTMNEIGVLAGDHTFGSLTMEQVEFYRPEGCLVLPELLTDEDMALAKSAMSEKVSQIADVLFAEGMIADKQV